MAPSARASLDLRGSKGKLLTSGRLHSPSVMRSLLALLLIGSNVGKAKAENSVAALIIFGDSLSDAGTNNVLPFAPKANFFPYGESYSFPPVIGPTGRFSNGRLVVDFIAQYLNLPLPTPYLQLIPIFHGTNFASAGSGILDTTNSLQGVISLSFQVNQFQTLVSDLQKFLGSANVAATIRNSIFTFASGSNDLLVYSLNPFLQSTTPRSVYISNMISTLAANIQKAIDAGGRKIVVAALPGFSFDQAVQDFNAQLQLRVNAFNAAGRAKVLYANTYKALNDIFANATSLGFTDTTSACCGGFLTTCGVGFYSVCPNPSNHIFWDNIHSTEKVYSIVANRFITGGQDIISPMNIAQLAQLP